MKLALISDIHGNLHAFERVLSELDEHPVEQIICLGDALATGPQPKQCLDLLRERKIPCVLGNADSWLIDPQPHENANDFMQMIEAIDLWCHQQLTPDDLAFISSFPPTIDFAFNELIHLHCFHGSPRSFNDTIIATTPDEDILPLLAGSPATLFAGGHTHQQLLRRIRDIVLINPGSVGLGYERERISNDVRNVPWAEYALIEADDGTLQISFHRTPLDVDLMIQDAQASGMPHVDWWCEMWQK